MPALLFLETFSKEPCSCSICVRLVNKSCCILQPFFKLFLLCCISVGLFVMLSLQGWRLCFYCPLTFPEPSCWFFKVLGVKPRWLLKKKNKKQKKKHLAKLSPFGFQSQMWQGFAFSVQVPHSWDAWDGVCSSPFSVPVVSLPPRRVSSVTLVSCLPLCPSYHFQCGLFSVINYGESVLPVFR